MGKIEYLETYLSLIIRFYKENALKKSDWETIAVDPKKDRVVFKRYNSEFNKNNEDGKI